MSENKKNNSQQIDLNTFFFHSIDLLCVADTEGHFKYINPQWEKTLGYPLKELEGIKYIELVHPEDIEKTISASTQLNETNSLHNFINRYKKFDGSYICLEWQAYQEGELIYSSARDVTERIIAEEVRKQNELWLSQSQMNSHIGSFNLNIKEGFWQSSIELDSIFGINENYKKTVEGWLNLIHPDDIEMMNDHFQRHVLQEKNQFNKEYRIIAQDIGDVRWVHGKGNLVYDNDGTPTQMIGTIQDITEQKKAKDEIILNEQLFRSIFDNSSLGIALVALDGRYLMVNAAMSKILGYTIEELKKIDFYKITHPDDIESSKNTINTLKEKKDNTINFSKRYIHKDGKTIWTDVSSRLIFDSNNKPLYFLTHVNDITERKLSEAAIKEKEERLKSIVENVEIIIYAIDKNGIFTLSEGRALEKLGLKPGQVVGLSVYDVYKENPNLIDGINRCLNGEPVKSVVNQHDIYFESRYTPTYDNHGNINGLFGISVDITDRKKAENELINSEKKYRLLFENMTSGFALHEMIYDENGKPFDYRYLEVNPAFEKLTGLPAKAMVGKTIKEMVPNIEDYWIQTFGNVALTGVPLSYMNYAKDLGNKCFDTYVFCPEKDKYAVVFNDVTERVNAESALKESEKKFSNFFNLTLDMVGITRFADGIIIDANPKFEFLTGYSPEEYLGKSTLELRLWESPEVRIHIVDYLKKNGEIKNFETKIRRKSGELVSILFSARTFEFNNELCLLFVINDISERIKSEIAIRESESRLRSFIDASSEGIVIIDETGVIVEWNSAAEKITGLSKSEVISQYWWDQILKNFPKERQTDDERNIIIKNLTEILKTGHVYTNENNIFPIFHLDGTKKHIERATFTIKTDLGYRIASVFHDITEKIKTEEALEKERIFNDALLASIPGLVYMYNEDGRLVRWNVKHETETGYTAEELNGMYILDWFKYSNEDLGSISTGLEKVKTDGYGTAEAYLQKKNGERTPYFFTAVTTIIEGKNYITGIGIDITERKKAEEALAFSNQILNVIIETIPIALYDIDTDGRVRSIWNPAAEKMLGWSKEETIGHFLPTIEEKDKADYNKLRKRVQSETIITGMEFDRVTKYGKPVSYSLYAAPLRDKSGNALGNIAALVDITEQKKMLLALQKSESLLKSTMESMNDGLLVVTSDYEITHINSSYKKIFDIPENLLELHNSKVLIEYITLKNSFSVDYSKQIDEIYKTNIPSEDVLHLTNGLIIERLSFPLPEDSPIKGRVWLFRDITERKIAENKITELNLELERKVEERTAKLNQANRELEAFAYSVSHDLRAPIRHIDGFSKLLFSKIKEPSDTIIDYQNKIISATNRMSSMIDSLLSFSRLGRKQLSVCLINLNELIQEIINLYTPDIGNRKIDWKIEKLPAIHGDKELIKLAFENLISNAIKYSAKTTHPIIEISAKPTTGDKVEICIKDNGVGFSMQYANKLFGVFQRLHSSEDYEGIGIGLANVKQIIEKHNCSVWAEGKLNEGATFCITLPK